MTNDLIPTQPGELATREGGGLALAGQVANRIAGAAVFTDYQARKAANTLRRQAGDLALFSDYLAAAGIPGELPTGDDLASDPASWAGVSWGLVAGFVRWLLSEGYSVSSVNVRLSTVKVYAALAAQAGALDRQELALIQAVKGYKRADAKHLDEKRQAAGKPTRRDTRRGLTTNSGDPVRAGRKTQPVSISKDQAAALKNRPDTPQGRRDALLMCLLLDHGLRVGEAARLTVDCFDLKAGELRFYRPKVDKVQTHRLTSDTLRAARAYLATDAPALGNVWRGSRKGKHGLTGAGLSARAITERVRALGAALGLAGLSAHDCRHYWATQAARNNTPIDRLQDAGGWASPAMPLRYVEAARIANDGVRLE